MSKDGYIKFNLNWEKKSVQIPRGWKTLNEVREKLYRLGLIGVYPNGVGFGNVSLRVKSGASKPKFLISGTKTGNKPKLNEEDYSLVTDFNIEANDVRCRGKVKASSESLTHAAVYTINPAVKSVLHIHSKELWEKFMYRFPTTDPDIEYGTPQMARALQRAVIGQTYLPVIMGGHEDGIISYGQSSREALSRILELMNRAR